MSCTHQNPILGTDSFKVSSINERNYALVH